MTHAISLDGNSLTRAQLVDVARGATVALDPAALQRVARAADFLAADDGGLLDDGALDARFVLKAHDGLLLGRLRRRVAG